MRYSLRSNANEELIAALFPPLEAEDEPKRGREKSAIFYGVCSALVTLFALSGLFLGAMTRPAVSGLVAGRTTLMNGALFGLILEIVRGSVTLPPSEPGFAFFPVLLYGMTYFLIAAIVCSLLFTIFAIIFPRCARQTAYANAFLVLFTYGGLFALSYAALGYRTGAQTAELFDTASALTASATAILIIVMAAVRKRKFAVVNAFLLLTSVLSLFALFVPNAAPIAYINALFEGGSALPTGVKASLCALIVLTVANAAVGIVRLTASERYFVDIIRFGLQAIAIFALIASSLTADGQGGVFSGQPTAMALLIASSFAAFLFSSFVAAFLAGRRKRKRRREDDAQSDL